MYTRFFGFAKKPFSLTPNAEFLFLSPQHQKALTLLRYGLTNQAGFMVITGEMGTGKSILVQHILKDIRDYEIGLITNTQEDFGDLLTWILNAFRVSPTQKTKVESYQAFVNFVLNKYQQNTRVLLVIDEAQNMSLSMLEELRLLSNINTGQDIMLQMILIGESNLVTQLSHSELRLFSQRIAIEYHLSPLTLEETQDYIKHRLTIAKGNEDIFDEMACAAIFYYSAGIPRIINTLCDLALVFAFAEDKLNIDIAIILNVIKEKIYIETFPDNLANKSERLNVKNTILQKTNIDITLL